jgi:phosphatidylcholine synthase
MHSAHTRFRRILAWCVHFYTALGLVAAAGIAVLIVRGGADSFRGAFLLMLVATVIDATDGALARRVRVKEVLPGFDGRRLDDLVDFLTYTSLPLLLLWRAEVLPAALAAWLLVPLLASAYGFSQTSAKTDDGYFLGFPSYWNLVAFYLYVLRPPAAVSLGVLLGLAFLTFVPTRYLYPSQRGRLNGVTNVLGAVWAAVVGWILFALPREDSPPDESVRVVTLVSLAYPLYYLVASWTITGKHWLRVRGRSRLPAQPVEHS